MRKTTTQCKNGHPYTEENTYHTKTNSVQCRTCDRKRKGGNSVSVDDTPNGWQTTPDIPVVETEPEEAELKIPKKLLDKERPLENQSVIPFWPKNGMVVTSDEHFPINDPAATLAKLKFIRAVKPDLYVNAGDLLDFWLASRFDKEADRRFGPFGSRLQDEIDSARPYIEEICSIVKQAHFIPGNHCHRFEKLIDANPALHGLRSLGWQNILAFPKNFYSHAYGTRLRINEAPLYIVHGDAIVPDRASAPAQYMLNKRQGQTTIFGHNHKAAEVYTTSYDQDRNPIVHGAISIGHGSLVTEQKYAGPEPQWQHAFAYVEFYRQNGKGRFSIHLIKIIDGVFRFNGTTFDGNKP